jgi:hypothetical protein
MAHMAGESSLPRHRKNSLDQARLAKAGFAANIQSLSPTRIEASLDGSLEKPQFAPPSHKWPAAASLTQVDQKPGRHRIGKTLDS